MSAIFIKLFNLSITASYMILAVLLLRLFLRRVPRFISCLLWGIVAIRLVMPFSIESALSLIPSAEPVPLSITYVETPAINSGIGVIDNAINPILSETFSPTSQTAPTVSANPIVMALDVATYVWLIGITAILIYGAVSYITLKKKVRPSLRMRGNIYFSDGIDTPFILGVLRPRIYIPSGMHDASIEYVLRHEQAHLSRKDHLWKPLGFVLLALYWFNPLVWVAYVLLCRDIEAACDEKVIRGMDDSERCGYSEALVSASVHRRSVMACPLAFGEVGVKSRIKSVLSYKKPAFWLVVLSMLACIVVAVGFLTGPIDTIDKVLDRDGYAIVNQHMGGVTLTVKKSDLPEAAFTEEGVTFRKNEIVAYESDTTSIYLHRVQYANEGNDKMYFVFDFDYTLPRDGGAFWYPYEKVEEGYSTSGFGVQSKELRDGNGATFEDSIAVRGQGAGTLIFLYVSTDALMAASDTVYFDITLNKILYQRTNAKVSTDEQIPYSDGYIDALRQSYPAYFGLDTSKGLDVYFCQFAAESYYLYLVSGDNTAFDVTDLWGMAHVSISEMRAILSTYDVDPDQVSVTYFQHSLSSYVYLNGYEEMATRTEHVKVALGLVGEYIGATVKTPPQALVSSGEYLIRATTGRYAWTYVLGDGITNTTHADTSHPLEYDTVVFYPEDFSASDTATLHFSIEPDEVKVEIYNIDTAKLVDTVTVKNNVIDLLEGEYLYYICATWHSSEAYNGTVYYSFRTIGE